MRRRNWPPKPWASWACDPPRLSQRPPSSPSPCSRPPPSRNSTMAISPPRANPLAVAASLFRPTLNTSTPSLPPTPTLLSPPTSTPPKTRPQQRAGCVWPAAVSGVGSNEARLACPSTNVRPIAFLAPPTCPPAPSFQRPETPSPSIFKYAGFDVCCGQDRASVFHSAMHAIKPDEPPLPPPAPVVYWPMRRWPCGLDPPASGLCCAALFSLSGTRCVGFPLRIWSTRAWPLLRCDARFCYD
mmetsp:Transcript_22952/g.39357  ORF Transcript_22952/g.39357 Transcript_22952/m.39357 type:complete len:242 (+) Transcript_22952:1398-2123(+)